MGGYELAVNDRFAVFSHVAFKWDRDIGSWVFLCAGRTEAEFNERLDYWAGKGEDILGVRRYKMRLMGAPVDVASNDADAG